MSQNKTNKVSNEMRLLLLVVLVYHAMCHVFARPGFGGSEQDWGYVSVRPNAHMFWWLYYSLDVSNYTERPLIMWLQGGPGMPSSGYGNFGEIGPQDPSLKPRNCSLVENFNVLFVDNPVGVGYSYFSNNSTAFVSNGDEIGDDLFEFFVGFLGVKPEFKNVPLYVFGESYGGRMATDFVYVLIKMQEEKGEICNLKGLALGDSYISPLDYVDHYAPLALHLGLIDKRGFTQIDELAGQIRNLIREESYEEAADLQDVIMDTLHAKIIGIDTYNLMAKIKKGSLPKLFDFVEELTLIMNGEVREKLDISPNITWEYYSEEAYVALKADLMTNVTYKGTIAWLDKLKWVGRDQWLNETQSPLEIDEVYEGYYKRVDKLVFYAVLRAGHSVPVDNLPTMNEILRRELLT